MQKYKLPSFDGALQQRTNSYIKKPTEVVDCGNVDFSSVIGSMVRRPGAQSSVVSMPELPRDATILGAFISRFPAGNEIWAAQNESGDATSRLKRWTGPGVSTWTDVITGLLPSAEINMTDDNDETWVAQYQKSTDTIGNSYTVDSSHSASLTRQLQFGPEARFFLEFNGAMWAANVIVSGVRYRDRLYKSSGLTGAISFVRAAVTLTQTADAPAVFSTALEVDSVRYLKATMPIDIYQAGTSNLLYSLTITSVDNALDTVSFTPDTMTFAATDITTATDVITVTTNTWMQTGTPVTFWGGTGVPGGVTSGTVYYVIRLTSTTINLAISLANALAGTPVVDFSTQGTGTHRLTFTLVLGNKDELWGGGRKGKLTRYWNTDYRNPEDSDWIKLPPTFDAGNDISAVGKLSARMFWFTENTMIRFDGQNIVVLKNDVGCIAMKTLVYYDSFMAWIDGKGQVWARNEEAGTMDIISIPIAKTMKLFTQDQLRAASGVCVGSKMKFYLGQIDGRSLRVTYDFQTNQWSKEWFTPTMPIQLEYIYNGVVKPHFFDEHGKMWVDEQGDDDNGEQIIMDSDHGLDDFGIDEVKSFKGIKIWSKNSAATKISVSIDGGERREVGQIEKFIQTISWEKYRLPKGTVIRMFIHNSSSSDPVQIDKALIYYTSEEDTIRATK